MTYLLVQLHQHGLEITQGALNYHFLLYTITTGALKSLHIGMSEFIKLQY